MATIDLTRSIFEPRKRYSGVRMQQGRVVLDDDHNEAADQAFEATRRALRDVVGPSGSPDDGFKISNFSVSTSGPSTYVDFDIAAGTMYVGGIPVTLDSACSMSSQTDWVGISLDDRQHTIGRNHEIVYLEVWQQPVSAAEDREIADVALGGPDTTTRLRTMARVRRASVSSATVSEAWAEVTDALETALIGTWNSETCELENDLKLTVGFESGMPPEDLCSPTVSAGYLGAENQAIRVQLIHKLGGPGTGELTWGYDNGAPLYRARLTAVNELTFETLPRDEAHWPLVGQVVEILPWSAVLVPDDASGYSGEVLADGGGRAAPAIGSALVSQGRGIIRKLNSSYNPTDSTVQLDVDVPTGFNSITTTFTGAGILTDRFSDGRSDLVFVRVWNRGSDLSPVARLPWTTSSELSLTSTGLKVTITGDMVNADAHWIIGARPESPDRLYPWILDQGGRPNGRRRYLTPLALVNYTTHVVQDCRETFRPLTRMKTCCRFVVGDGDTSHGDYSSIQEAIDNLPSTGGEICVLPGKYQEEILIDGLSDVTIHGCGAASLLRVNDPTEAVLTIRDATGIKIENLGITSLTGWGIVLEQDTGTLEDIQLSDLTIKVRDAGAIRATDVTTLKIERCTLSASSLTVIPSDTATAGRFPLIYVSGSDIEIRRNGLTAETDLSSPALRATGGIQVAGGSQDVAIIGNHIEGGNGNGITLGSVETEESTTSGFFFLLPYWYWESGCLRMGWRGYGVGPTETVTLISGGDVEDIRIRRNVIADMASDGIGVAMFFEKATTSSTSPTDFITVRKIRITNNNIRECNTAERSEDSTLLSGWYAHGPIALADVQDGLIRDNEIRDNGTNHTDPICGIFVMHAEGVVIQRNRVTENGAQSASGLGMYGGIVVPHGGPYYPDGSTWDGRASLRVLSNQVVTHSGPAVWVSLASGTVEVSRNELTSTTNAVVALYGMLMELLNGGMYFEDFGEETSTTLSTSSDTGGQLVVHDNVLSYQPPSGGATAGLSIVYMLTFDDVDCKDNNSRSDLQDNFFFYGWRCLAATVHVTNNRIRETPLGVKLSIYSTSADSLSVNETHGNLCTHCVKVYEGSAEVTTAHNRSISDLSTPSWCGGITIGGLPFWTGSYPRGTLVRDIYTMPGGAPIGGRP